MEITDGFVLASCWAAHTALLPWTSPLRAASAAKRSRQQSPTCHAASKNALFGDCTNSNDAGKIALAALPRAPGGPSIVVMSPALLTISPTNRPTLDGGCRQCSRGLQQLPQRVHHDTPAAPYSTMLVKAWSALCVPQLGHWNWNWGWD